MLKPTHKTARELGISDLEHFALRDVLYLMESGRIRHIRVGDSAWNKPSEDVARFSGLFNMSWVKHQSDCGTVACILGTAQLLHGDDIFWRSDKMPDPLYNLFYPNPCRVRYDNVSVKEAARQLRSYLETGTHEWAR